MEKVEMLFTLQYLVKTEKEIDVSTIKMFFDREKFSFGYAWLFPKSKNTANIGLGSRGDLKEKFEYFMRNVLKEDIGRYELLDKKDIFLSKRFSFLFKALRRPNLRKNFLFRRREYPAPWGGDESRGKNLSRPRRDTPPLARLAFARAKRAAGMGSFIVKLIIIYKKNIKPWV